MFANVDLKPVRPIAIDLLSGNDFEFYLTGQRFFCRINDSTTWKFFAEDTSSVRQFLEDSGFVIDARMAMCAQQLGCTTAFLMRVAGGEVSELEPHQADVVVQLVQDAKKYSAIQEAMRNTYGGLFPTDSEEVRNAWSVAIALFNVGIAYAEDNVIPKD